MPSAYGNGVRKALVLGGGEGLLARELLKLPELEEVTIVDLDQRIFDLAGRHGGLSELNNGALSDPRTRVRAQDAAVFLRNDTAYYDLIIADLPDPSSESVARLYSTWFFKMAGARLAKDGVFATQATSPYHTRDTYWCIYETLRASGFRNLVPYHVNVPSFGEWGFIMASGEAARSSQLTYRKDAPVTFLDTDLVANMTHFPKDMGNPGNLRPNRLDKPVLLDYFLEEWSSWQREKTM